MDLDEVASKIRKVAAASDELGRLEVAEQAVMDHMLPGVPEADRRYGMQTVWQLGELIRYLQTGTEGWSSAYQSYWVFEHMKPADQACTFTRWSAFRHAQPDFVERVERARRQWRSL